MYVRIMLIGCILSFYYIKLLKCDHDMLLLSTLTGRKTFVMPTEEVSNLIVWVCVVAIHFVWLTNHGMWASSRTE